VLVGDQRTIAVAVGGDQRIEATLGRPVTRQTDVLGPDGLGIDRDDYGLQFRL